MGATYTFTPFALASDTTWDGVVIGAGPAGAMAARELALSGRRVLLVERKRFPRWKICGACLNAHALACLRSAGLGSLVERHGGIRLDGYRLVSATARLVSLCPKERHFLDRGSTPPSSMRRLTLGQSFWPRRRHMSAEFETGCGWCDRTWGRFDRSRVRLYWWPPAWATFARPYSSAHDPDPVRLANRCRLLARPRTRLLPGTDNLHGGGMQGVCRHGTGGGRKFKRGGRTRASAGPAPWNTGRSRGAIFASPASRRSPDSSTPTGRGQPASHGIPSRSPGNGCFCWAMPPDTSNHSPARESPGPWPQPRPSRPWPVRWPAGIRKSRATGQALSAIDRPPSARWSGGGDGIAAAVVDRDRLRVAEPTPCGWRDLSFAM